MYFLDQLDYPFDLSNHSLHVNGDVPKDESLINEFVGFECETRGMFTELVFSVFC